MPTKRRRIVLTADPELDAAIAAARRGLGDIPESRLVRELALRGAARQRGIAWPTRSMADSLSTTPIGESKPDDPYRGTRALEHVRRDRI